MNTVDIISNYARNTSKTHDTQYNRGRKDCIAGNIWTEDAHYFLFCEQFQVYKESTGDVAIQSTGKPQETVDKMLAMADNESVTKGGAKITPIPVASPKLDFPN